VLWVKNLGGGGKVQMLLSLPSSSSPLPFPSSTPPFSLYFSFLFSSPSLLFLTFLPLPLAPHLYCGSHSGSSQCSPDCLSRFKERGRTGPGEGKAKGKGRGKWMGGKGKVLQ